MANRYPLVRYGGKTRQFEAGDSLQLRGALNDPAMVAITATDGVDIMNRASSVLQLNASGSVTINAFGSGTAGVRRTLFFNSAQITMFSTTNLKLPGGIGGGAQITTSVGDAAEFLCEGGIVWRCLWYMRAAFVLNDKLPLSGGRMTGAINFAPYVAATAVDNLNIEALNSNIVQLSYTGAGLSLNNFAGGTDGTRRIVWFNNTGPLTLVHNASLMSLPSLANIVVAAGDIAEFYCTGGLPWRCIWYQRRNGTSLVGAPDATKLPLAGGTMTGAINYAGYVTLTAADNLAIEAVNSNTVRVDYSGGALNINAFGAGTNGTRRILYFNNTAPFTLLHDASLTVLPGNASIVPARGDFAEFQCEGGSTWRCMWYQRRDGTALIASSDANKEPVITPGTSDQFWRGDKVWTNFATTVRAAVLTGLSTATSAAIAATDSVLDAFGKLQAQITTLTSTVAGKAAIAAVNVFTANQAVAPATLTSGTTIAVDASLSNNFKLVLATNATLSNPTNLTDGMVLNFRIKQDATGSRTLAFGSKYKFPGGADKILTTGANAVDLLSCYYDATDDTLSCNLSKGFA